MPRLQVTSKVRILALLDSLIASGEAIGVGPLGEVQLYSSAIAEVDESRKALILEAIKNEQSHDSILQTGKLRVCAYLNGVRVQFITALQKAANPSEEPGIYRVGLPAYLLYYQQREKDRFRLEDQQIEISGIAPDSAFLTGFVQDISETGLGLSVRRYGELKTGDILEEVRLVLPGAKEVFRCNLEIRTLKLTEDSRMNIGAKFVGLDLIHQQRVKQSLVALEKAS